MKKNLKKTTKTTKTVPKGVKLTNQDRRIVTYMKAKEDRTITPMEAFKELGCTKLATRIGILIKKGYVIQKNWEKSNNRFGEEVRYRSYTLKRLTPKPMESN